MRKTGVFILILAFILAFKAPDFAYGASLALDSASVPQSEESSEIPGLPAGPLDPWVNKLKSGIQSFMENARIKLMESAGEASESAQQAAKDEIRRQADQGLQEAQKGLSDSAKRVWENVKNKTTEIISKIKIFFQKVFEKNPTKTY